MAIQIQNPVNTPNLSQGPYLAKIVSHLDPNNMGSLEVEILREVGNDANSASQVHQVKYMTPFYGVTNIDFNSKSPDSYNNTQKSYGMWMIPPDVGTLVIVIFIEGDPRRGYWIGCVQDEKMNFMVPGYASTKFVVEGSKSKDVSKIERLPVAEYNKKSQTQTQDANKYLKPAHPFQNVLYKQGLHQDDIRGITTSSARREVPSAVFGISTPGPIDKQEGAKQGSVGKAEYNIANAFVSRLGGSSFVMDDGDDKFLRKNKPKDGPPIYASVEAGETGGLPDWPHNELIRLRTRTGHQILLHNSEDLIYIANARGTTWIELTSDGKIDIYAKDSVSIKTENDLNVTAKRSINLYGKEGVNIASDKAISINGTAQVNINSQAQATGQAKIPRRVPNIEPWQEHENLDPSSFKPGSTTAIPIGTHKEIKPAAYQKYTAKLDTFEKIKPKK
jgi:hypothetical protein